MADQKFEYAEFVFHFVMINGKLFHDVKVRADEVFEFCAATNAKPCLGITKSGERHAVMRCYLAPDGNYNRFEGGNSSPFTMIEKAA